MKRTLLCVFFTLGFALSLSAADKIKPLVLFDFENKSLDELKDNIETDSDDVYDPNVIPAELSVDFATSGKQSLKFVKKEKAGVVRFKNFPGDWSKYDVLKFDLYVPGKQPLGGGVTISDAQTDVPKDRPRAIGMYDTRADVNCLGKPGKSTVEIDLNGLTTNGGRGMDTKTIKKFIIYFDGPEYYIDNIRLEKSEE